MSPAPSLPGTSPRAAGGRDPGSSLRIALRGMQRLHLGWAVGCGGAAHGHLTGAGSHGCSPGLDGPGAECSSCSTAPREPGRGAPGGDHVLGCFSAGPASSRSAPRRRIPGLRCPCGCP